MECRHSGNLHCPCLNLLVVVVKKVLNGPKIRQLKVLDHKHVQQKLLEHHDQCIFLKSVQYDTHKLFMFNSFFKIGCSNQN